MTKKIFLLLFLCILFANQAWTQSGTYIANGVTWKYKLEGSPKTATITGEVLGKTVFSSALNIPNDIVHGGTHYTVTKINDNAFSNYGEATTLSIPTLVTTIGKNAFSQCRKMTGTLYLPNVTTIGNYAFINCMGLTGKLELPKAMSIGEQAFSNCKGLTMMSLPKITMIGDWAFSGCTGLEGVLELPKTLTSLGEYAFANTTGTNLKAIKFENGTNLINIEKNSLSGTYLAYVDMVGVNFPPGFIASYNNLGTSVSTMVYLPSTASINPDDINIVRGNLCNKFRVYDGSGNHNDGCEYPIQYPFTAATATYDRGFYNAICQTLYLPYPATLPDGMRAYTLQAKTVHGGITHFRFVSIGDGGTQLQANKPYLIRVTDGSTSKQFGMDVNVQVPVTPSIASTEVQDANGQGFYFGGTAENIDNATAAGMKAYNLINNEWRPIRTDNPNGYIHSLRAYMRTTGAAPAKGFAIVLDDEDSTTGIDTAVENEVEQGNSPIYTLDGKLMGTDIDALPSGEIYVKNGKKFYKF